MQCILESDMGILCRPHWTGSFTSSGTCISAQQWHGCQSPNGWRRRLGTAPLGHSQQQQLPAKGKALTTHNMLAFIELSSSAYIHAERNMMCKVGWMFERVLNAVRQ